MADWNVVSVDDHSADERIAEMLATTRHRSTYVTYFLPNQKDTHFINREKLSLTVSHTTQHLAYYIGAKARDQQWFWNPLTASFLTRDEETARMHTPDSGWQFQYRVLNPGEILTTLALAKAAFKQLCGARPDIRLRVHIHVYDGGRHATRHETHALINANQTKAVVEELRRRRALWTVKRALANPYTPVGRRRLLAEFESMQYNLPPRK